MALMCLKKADQDYEMKRLPSWLAADAQQIGQAMKLGL
jgi:hypothetical protein